MTGRIRRRIQWFVLMFGGWARARTRDPDRLALERRALVGDWDWWPEDGLERVESSDWDDTAPGHGRARRRE